MGRINKNDIINQVAEDAYISKADAKAAVDSVFNVISDALANGNEVDIANFGALVPYERKQRIGTDPETHKQITIKSRQGVRLRLSKTLKGKLTNG